MKSKGRPQHQDILTPAEWRVVSLVQHGLTNPQMAEQLQVSINTIKYHITNDVEKLRIHSHGQVSNKKSLLHYLGAPKDSPFHRSQHMKKATPIQSLGQISRTVKNIAQSETWYKDVLGLKHLYTYGQLAFFDLNGVRLMLSEADDKDSTTQSASVLYFQTEDIKYSHQQLSEKGITFSHAPHKVHVHDDGTEEWMAFFNDSEGRPLGLMGQYK
ncbi:LuxR C-terminal-related transcriptional regulator [Marinicella litoralis]|uniref:Glyoxalase/bleomycin resistance protein/dioxygenase superfamily protein n=1 Tax=Marinicella litoralis TaxID=644220 RepID=A0A4R6XS57_9GAMM|nr:LuxR C-terminal-related transcriptional regulator [Marinicella litoralis]TDR22596.1 glyoxalase/bleomycin resistance protein/dioxygenase superfamily protein [Marinicella litoralis]